MTDAKAPYEAPLMKLVIRPGVAVAMTWKLEIRALDAKGERHLGYRASGENLVAVAAGEAFAVQVHDELRDVWTEMPSNHRADVRQSMQKLLTDAAVSLASLSPAKAV